MLPLYIDIDSQYGCLCNKKWEGSHCQYKRRSDFTEDLGSNNDSIENSESASSSGEGLPLMVIIFVTIGGLAVFAATLFVIGKKYVNKKSLRTMEFVTGMEKKNMAVGKGRGII